MYRVHVVTRQVIAGRYVRRESVTVWTTYEEARDYGMRSVRLACLLGQGVLHRPHLTDSCTYAVYPIDRQPA